MTLPDFTLNRANGEALYRQLVKNLRNAIESGELKDGERLPSERALATQLGLSRTTVVTGYRELESRGLVRSHVGRGTFVCASSEAFEAPFAWRGKVSAGAAFLNSASAGRNLLHYITPLIRTSSRLLCYYRRWNAFPQMSIGEPWIKQ